MSQLIILYKSVHLLAFFLGLLFIKLTKWMLVDLQCSNRETKLKDDCACTVINQIIINCQWRAVAKINLDVDDIVSPNRGLIKFPTIGLNSLIKISDLASHSYWGGDGKGFNFISLEIYNTLNMQWTNELYIYQFKCPTIMAKCFITPR